VLLVLLKQLRGKEIVHYLLVGVFAMLYLIKRQKISILKYLRLILMI